MPASVSVTLEGCILCIGRLNFRLVTRTYPWRSVSRSESFAVAPLDSSGRGRFTRRGSLIMISNLRSAVGIAFRGRRVLSGGVRSRILHHSLAHAAAGLVDCERPRRKRYRRGSTSKKRRRPAVDHHDVAK